MLTRTLDKLSKLYNYEVIASYRVVYKQRDNVLSFFPVNSQIICCIFSFFYAHVLQINPLLPFFNVFFRDARASVRTGSYAPGLYKNFKNTPSLQNSPDITNTSWCTCDKCEVRATARECICCVVEPESRNKLEDTLYYCRPVLTLE